jgi:hypothetical protein
MSRGGRRTRFRKVNARKAWFVAVVRRESVQQWALRARVNRNVSAADGFENLTRVSVRHGLGSVACNSRHREDLELVRGP